MDDVATKFEVYLEEMGSPSEKLRWSQLAVRTTLEDLVEGVRGGSSASSSTGSSTSSANGNGNGNESENGHGARNPGPRGGKIYIVQGTVAPSPVRGGATDDTARLSAAIWDPSQSPEKNAATCV